MAEHKLSLQQTKPSNTKEKENLISKAIYNIQMSSFQKKKITNHTNNKERMTPHTQKITN